MIGTTTPTNAKSSAHPHHSKGKSRQLLSDDDTSLALAPSSLLSDVTADASGSAQHPRSLRSFAASPTPRHDRYCGRSTPASSLHHEESSLKRSIREMGSSPSSSPRQQIYMLPTDQASSSAAALSLTNDSQDASAASTTQTPSSSRQAQSSTSTANKKRRSLRLRGPDFQSRAALDGQEQASMDSAGTSRVATFAPSETEHRRASLLVNSSTRDAHSLASHSAFCVSPEPLHALDRAEQSSSDVSYRRAAFLDSARAQRTSSSIRRRRGFYLRDADLLRNDAPQRTAPSDERSSSRTATTTSDTFMDEFARAVDLRLSARSDSSHGNAIMSPAAGALPTQHQQPRINSAAERNAPQLPYVRTASPLTVPFEAVETDDTDRNAHRALSFGSLRRRTLIPTPALSSSDRPSSRTLYSQPRWYAAPSHPSERSELLQEHEHRFSDRARHETRSNDAPLRVAVTSVSERSHAEGFQLTETGTRLPEPQSSELEVADDFGAVRRPFGLQRRALGRARLEGVSTSSSNAPVPAGQESGVGSRRDAHHLSERQSDEARYQSSSLPWRRTHFGLRAPSQHPERNLSALQTRFEPFAERLDVGGRHTGGSASSRGRSSSSLYRERSEDESALEYLGRLMSHDSMLDEWMDGDVRAPLLRMAIESGGSHLYPQPLLARHAPASTSSMFGHATHLAFDARNFIADEDWAELNSYEGLMQLGERLGAAEICVPQSLIDTLPTCEYGKWDGGSCRQRDDAGGMVGKGKGKQKVEPPPTARDTMCPICREDYLDSDMLMSINKCSHAFHADCIKTWFKAAKTCPLCRADAFDEICLPALPFQSSSSSAATTVRAVGAGEASAPAWSFSFES
ncbi:zinc finger containing protein [Pseudozyma hubeiensis SY62]|uniref:Zinc finger containing protein n=1 Tax=Pseudozyma hubeiensis (strain SY62) TaxID=1305764 RepID=R9PE49_PSEHS|nr:zinc finger containing protein [Pseudozyma hubeiensis SY62]GAC99636.1 zinc finger containing protein [Pseudozyma hubeiensis SY62]